MSLIASIRDEAELLAMMEEADATGPEEGETEEEFAERRKAITDTLLMITDDIQAGADAYVYVIRKLEADAEYLKKEKQRIERRQKSLENNAKYMKETLRWAMHLSGDPKIKTAKNTISLRTTQKVVVDVEDPDELLDKYVRIKKEANLTAIKEDLKAGKVVEGAHMEDSESLIIR